MLERFSVKGSYLIHMKVVRLLQGNSQSGTYRRGMTPTPVNLAGNIASVITPKAQNSFLTRANSGNPYRNLKFKKTPQSSRSSSANVKEDKLIRAEARINSIIFKRQQK
uniref:Uncharacterized protein n=1 Tax=Euplotes crassus TaxID=5936 RepID=A0A7S3P178_EUPCR|mmetsp:Transcript_4606/g.4305  ORF Transcript_4606/g.4305 Transcript_4606/m.4305 type:complete len:109 (+) Transcript_4606:335-661(+)